MKFYNFWEKALLPLSIALFCFLVAGLADANAAQERTRPGELPKMSPSLCVYVHLSQGSATNKRSESDREDELKDQCQITSKQADCLFDEHPKEEVGSISDLIEACKI